MEKHKCNICLRSFTCGRALGGHMRSHLVNHVSRTNSEKEENEDFFSIQSSSSSRVKENLDFHDGDSEIVCSKKAVPVQKSKTKFEEQRLVGLISEKTPVEEIAYCLMMLKKDSWKRREKEEAKLIEPKPSISTKMRVKYKCDTCCKVFRSYQALGGHRASHKKGLIANRGSRNEEKESRERSTREKTHQCVVCLKSFSSGQALGGHKRSHLSGLEANYLVDSPIKNDNSMIDLNLPPTIDDDDDDERSQIVSHS